MPDRSVETQPSATHDDPAGVLAPAGYFRCIERALAAGADAVYFGGQLLPHMRSQGQAANLSREEVARAIALCHASGARAYYTANSPYRAGQLEALDDSLAELVRLGVDAVVMSDLALIARTAERFPELEICASVQLGTANARAAELLGAMGARRIVVERSVSVEDAARLKERTGLPVEMFVFGPQCASHDALCYLGQYFTGTVCKNSCMTPFRGEGRIDGRRRWAYLGFYSALARVPDIVRLGIDGLKIEGRSRSSRYVALVTRVFREAVDAARRGDFEIRPSWTAALAEAALFSEVTEGFHGDFFDREPPPRSFSNRSRLAFLREMATILAETRNVRGVLSELELAARIDKLYELTEGGVAALRRFVGGA